MRRFIYLVVLILIFVIYSRDGRNNNCYPYSNDDQLRKFIKSDKEVNYCITKKSHYYPRQNATILMLCKNEDVYQVLETLQNFQDRFNAKFNYDYTFLNDVPFTDEFVYLITSYIPYNKVNFGLIPSSHWSYPPHINQELANEIRHNFKNVPYSTSLSYRHMSRFYSGFFYKHPMVSQYQYYWRIEPGIKLLCDVNYDVFNYMHLNKKKYGYVISLFEYSDTIPTLWNHIVDYIHLRNIQSDALQLLINQYSWYNLCHFWSNFEIANLDVFNEEYEDYFQYLDSKGGFYYERWGDAPVHTIGVCLFQNKSSIHWFDDIGYYHAPYVQCPQNLQKYIENKCVCDINEDFSTSDLSCNLYFNHVLNI